MNKEQQLEAIRQSVVETLGEKDAAMVKQVLDYSDKFASRIVVKKTDALWGPERAQMLVDKGIHETVEEAIAKDTLMVDPRETGFIKDTAHEDGRGCMLSVEGMIKGELIPEHLPELEEDDFLEAERKYYTISLAPQDIELASLQNIPLSFYLHTKRLFIIQGCPKTEKQYDDAVALELFARKSILAFVREVDDFLGQFVPGATLDWANSIVEPEIINNREKIRHFLKEFASGELPDKLCHMMDEKAVYAKE